MNGADQQRPPGTGRSVSVGQCVVLAGIGGTMPTIARMATTYVTDPSTPLPELGMLFGLLLFFIIGGILCFVSSERNLRKAFILGVSAPGIITNMVAGYQDTNASDTSVALHTPSILDSSKEDPHHRGLP
jgi:hypothetical protein